jgi:alkanesulfonate monooxygenase SsuD/methylene tetrahydromethanopterin reductase-like flavin-dependent oxidoreductase (luciferase family)
MLVLGSVPLWVLAESGPGAAGFLAKTGVLELIPTCLDEAQFRVARARKAAQLDRADDGRIFVILEIPV